MLKRAFNILIGLSIIFLLVYLIRFDYILFNEISFRYDYLLFSVILLFLGFYLSTYSWYQSLKLHGININPRKALVSHGKSVFAKYIPGKIWVILGRAAKISQLGFPLKTCSIVSLKEQLIYILLGLVLSIIPIILLDISESYLLLVVIVIIGLALVLFSKNMHLFVLKTYNRIFKKELEIPLISFKIALKLSVYILLYWLVWVAAFYFLLMAVNPKTSFIAAFAFPLSVSFGVLAIVAPGGIGVREGIMVAFLIAADWNKEMAITLSVLSRLWFVSGEIFLFTLSLLFKFQKNEAK